MDYLYSYNTSMGVPEFRFTVFSGTSVRNFKELAFVSDGKVFYKKDGRFPNSDVFFARRLTNAIYFARSYTSDPLVMCASLPIFLWFVPIFRKIPIYPVDQILVPSQDLPFYEFPPTDRNARRINYSDYFIPEDVGNILGY